MVKTMEARLANRAAARRFAAAMVTLLMLGGCSMFSKEPPPPPPPPPAIKAPLAKAPLATHIFAYEPGVTAVLGELQVTRARHEDTLVDIARRFNVGYDELRNANPGVDPWLPGEGTTIVLPTLFVMPDGPREGILINVAAMRLFYFPKAATDAPRTVVTYPIGIGRIGRATPLGTTKVVSKRKGPAWTPPASVRKEHAAAGESLPARVRPGPDNPLGAYAMNLGWPSYLIHGTNKPPSVGMRASHGCIRLYPEDIESLFGEVAVGTKVTVVNQPLLAAWQGNSLYVQSFPVPVQGEDEDEDDNKAPAPVAYDDKVAARLQQLAGKHGASVNATLASQAVTQARGIAVPVSRTGLTMDAWLGGARRVENTVPEGSNWDGSDDLAAAGPGKPQ
jgi:L,D-transpeptidase ErfK/SrfK